MPEISADCLDKTVQLFYAGEIQVSAQHLPELKRALQSLQVPDLNISLAPQPVVEGVKLPEGLSMTKVPPKRDLTVKPAAQPIKRMRADSVNPATIAKLTSLGAVTNVMSKSKPAQMTPPSMQAASIAAKQPMQIPPMRPNPSNAPKGPPNAMPLHQPMNPPRSLFPTNAENIQNNSAAPENFIKPSAMTTPNVSKLFR